MRVGDVSSRSILCKSGISSIDYCVNPYVGCAHACVYCYATYMRRFTGHMEQWGTFVDAKVNAPEVLAREISRARPGTVSLSTVCDPYQPCEAELGLTRRCLEEFAAAARGFQVRVLTKSDLCVRDVDVLTELGASVGITLTTVDNETARMFEPGASRPPARLRALAKLNETGLATHVFFGPVLPFFSDAEQAIERLLSAIGETGTRRLLVDDMNLRPDILRRLGRMYRRWPKASRHLARMAGNLEEYDRELKHLITERAERYGLTAEFCF